MLTTPEVCLFCTILTQANTSQTISVDGVPALYLISVVDVAKKAWIRRRRERERERERKNERERVRERDRKRKKKTG